MARLNKERQQELEPRRMEYAIKQIESLGYNVLHSTTSLSFQFRGHKVVYYPYSGWATGKSINDGRGLQNLIKQIKIKKY